MATTLEEEAFERVQKWCDDLRSYLAESLRMDINCVLDLAEAQISHSKTSWARRDLEDLENRYHQAVKQLQMRDWELETLRAANEEFSRKSAQQKEDIETLLANNQSYAKAYERLEKEVKSLRQQLAVVAMEEVQKGNRTRMPRSAWMGKPPPDTLSEAFMQAEDERLKRMQEHFEKDVLGPTLEKALPGIQGVEQACWIWDGELGVDVC